MRPLSSMLFLCFVLSAGSTAFAQPGEAPLKIFGYFQTSAQHWTAFDDHQEFNSFSLQQLNLFFQKDIARGWSAFVNFEFLNNFSSSSQWGSANLEEAWLRFRLNENFNLKVGLQIPIFNNLNTIKNRTPLLPYIVRPLAYESSFNEFFPIDEFVPPRAYIQAYGFLLSGRTKFEYAAYIGNSRNINRDSERGQTGVDTTTTLLFGGRLGIRYQELRFGVSATHEKRNDFIDQAPLFGRSAAELEGLPAVRVGADLSYHFADFSLESEFINVNIRGDIPELGIDLDFYYATLGYNVTDRLFLYGSYWLTRAHVDFLFLEGGFVENEEIAVPNSGIAYNLMDRIRLKAQYARVRDEDVERDPAGSLLFEKKERFNIYTLAVSVFF